MRRERLITASLEALPNYILVDAAGKIVFINQSYTSLLGITQEEAAGKDVAEVVPGTKLREVITGGKAETGDIMTFFDHGKGKEVQLVCNRIPLSENGKVIGALGVTTFENMEDVRRMYAELSQVRQENDAFRKTIRQLSDPLEKIIGTSEEMLEIKQTVVDFAGSELTILMTGETGVGKEVFASAVHSLSRRSKGPYVRINCAAIPKDLLESELFGYEEGAFTGAKRSGKTGKFEQADKGTILLDEIGEMPMELQTKLLRVLQEKEIEKVGGTKPKKIDVRVLCSTNKNLARMVREGTFREDLYYRVNTVEILIPPLRRRTSDIPALSSFFLQKVNASYGIHCLGPDSDVMDLFMEYPWPGNVRELEHTMERLAFLNPDGHITLRDCGFLVKRMTDRQADAPLPSKEGPYGPEILGETLYKGGRYGNGPYVPVSYGGAVRKAAGAGEAAIRDMDIGRDREIGMDREPAYESLQRSRDAAEIRSIQAALQRTDGNRTKAAELLGLSRSMLYKKLRKYGI